MNRAHKIALTLVAGAAMASQAMAQVTFYEHDGFQGRSFTTERRVPNFERFGFNDRASSVVVSNNRWEVCDDAGFQGRCVVLRPGSYGSLGAMGLNDRVSSVRAVPRDLRVEDSRYAPAPVVDRDYRRRRNERLFEAPVTSVRAVVSQPDRRCWVEREQVVQERHSNVPGGIAGAVIGGILGHQVGGGSGRDVATVGGAVAGAAIGARISRDRNGNEVVTRDVQRCETAPAAAPEYYDVTYSFRGIEHRVQLTAPPGATVTVNRDGEPRAA
ncbi:beta/gamma crystallin-related protein [Aquabacterium sp.]|uniref:beta/gamma crystallin-related protein n=1 Tax=Aquabacterium sp. TaxID=1872578 RepID=UPI002C566B5F|nr:beta/gamma crystallin-related protein [Aquabacterium sp.]HSW05691.1 beta/gamma crystallin-related protein [Aquabacterium sp.]